MNVGVVEVRIRSYYESDAAYLTHWPIADLNQLVRSVSEWGFDVDGAEDDGEVVGQFAVGADSYFEIVVGVA